MWTPQFKTKTLWLKDSDFFLRKAAHNNQKKGIDNYHSGSVSGSFTHFHQVKPMIPSSDLALFKGSSANLMDWLGIWNKAAPIVLKVDLSQKLFF